MQDYIVAIPARYASTRLPGKPLASVGGEPMIRRVCEQALKSGASLVVACVDDERVRSVLDGCGAEVCMTSQDCKSGTDRIAEMIRILGIPRSTTVVNVQGDEPLIDPGHISQVASLLESSGAGMATLCARITEPKDVFDPNCVKVVMDAKGYALYFSRAPIPYERGNFDKNPTSLKFDHYHHIGIYAYKAGTVLDYTAMPQPEIEKCESLEQLRLMDAGFRIAVGVTGNPPEAGVDTAEDLARVNRILKGSAN
jgi:3-deoxy-manno-octulosonate cytidylyltransferase (CMP-KDO synthetase)